MATSTPANGCIKKASYSDIFNVEQSIDDLRLKMDSILKSIGDLSKKHSSLQEVICDGGSHITADPTSTQPVNVPTKEMKPPSYADVVSADMVKSVVSQVLHEQRRVDADGSTIAIYGFPEEGNDYEEIMHMFAFLRCRCDIIHQSRIGYAANRSKESKKRPIKVQLKLSGDAKLILSNAKYLRNNPYYEGVYISKWLSKQDFNSMKQLRQQCLDLNAAYSADKKGRGPYVVVSGKIMQRSTNGKLLQFNNDFSIVKPSLPASENAPIKSSGGTLTNSKNV